MNFAGSVASRPSDHKTETTCKTALRLKEDIFRQYSTNFGLNLSRVNNLEDSKLQVLNWLRQLLELCYILGLFLG